MDRKERGICLRTFASPALVDNDIGSKYKRCKYYFELHTEEEVWYYFEDGFLTEEQMQMDGRMLQCFTVPWMNPADINVTPDWVNETVWYQIFRTGSAGEQIRRKRPV